MLAHDLPKVLVVDDEPDVRAFVIDALEHAACYAAGARDAREALNEIESGDYDVVVSDLYMPGVPGIELLKLAQQSQWDLAIILMSGKPQIADLVDSVRFRAADMLLKPFAIEQLLAAVARSYSTVRSNRRLREQLASLDATVQRRTQELQAAVRSLQNGYRDSLEALVTALDAREHETCAHSFRVRDYTSYLARLAGYSAAAITELETAALLHDIGKIAVPDEILLSPRKLSVLEFEQMKAHAQAGAEILNHIRFLKPASTIVRHHHERYDGGGYPSGLAGEAIPLGSRIFAVVDTMDAMTSDRSYRRALPYEAARQEIIRCSGTQFDPRIVQVFLDVPKSVWSDLRRETGERFRASLGTSLCPSLAFHREESEFLPTGRPDGTASASGSLAL